MILKEAYRYQNFLTNLISSAQTYLGNGLFVMTTTQKHLLVLVLVCNLHVMTHVIIFLQNHILNFQIQFMLKRQFMV